MTGDVTARREANRLAAKRYRARQRERAKAAERSGRGYSWPPFAPGHELSMVHGARSPRRVDPLAQELIDQLFALPDCPAALREPRFRWAVESWARVQAQIELVTAWIADQVAEHGLQEALSETSSAEETLSVRKGGTRKVTAGRRMDAALNLLGRLERQAANLRGELGLSPRSAAAMGLSLQEKPFSLMTYWMERDKEKNDDG